MATAHNVQTKRDIVKILQYVGETDTVATPANYGVTPTSPTFIAAGHNKEINLQPDVQHLDTEVLGNEQIVDAVKTGELHAWQCTFEPTDTVLMAYAVDDSGGAAGSIDESLTFMFSELLDGVENWTAMRGCRCTNMTATLERGVWEVTMTWICREITVPATSDPFTTPTYATEPTASSMTHSGAGADPFTWNAVALPESRFSITVIREMAVEAINGEDLIVYCKAAGKRAEASVDVFVKNTNLDVDWQAKTKRAMNYSVSTSPNKDFAFVDAVITSHSRTKSAVSSDGFKESVTIRAEQLTDFV